MDFSDAPRKPRAEAIVPMINVVFLLLIFFLMTSQIAPPEPFEITAPTSSAEQEAAAELTLYIDAKGTLSFDGVEGDAAFAALSGLTGADVLIVKADAKLEATRLAAMLARLTQIGFGQVELVVAQQ